jgi:hypothetical protein
LLLTFIHSLGSDDSPKMPFLKKWVRTRHAILFRLSNRTVQVLFFDRSEVHYYWYLYIYMYIYIYIHICVNIFVYVYIYILYYSGYQTVQNKSYSSIGVRYITIDIVYIYTYIYVYIHIPIYIYLAGLYGNIWYRFFNTLLCNFYNRFYYPLKPVWWHMSTSRMFVQNIPWKRYVICIYIFIYV